MRGGVFICHASEDAETARQIVGALESAGVGCWIAPRDIEVGESYTQAILEALKAAPALVLVFSAAADRSPHVVRELETAVGSATRIVPVRLEDIEPSPSLRYFIGTAQWLDVSGRVQAEWEAELVAALRRTVAGQRDTAYAAGEPGRRWPRRSASEADRTPFPAARGAGGHRASGDRRPRCRAGGEGARLGRQLGLCAG